MVITQDDVLDFVQKNGPLLSIRVAKHFKMNTTYAGAYLSELVSKKKLKFSHMKIGTSPLYYTESQKEKLQEYSDKLNTIEKRAYDLLKQKKILRESEIDNITKTGLRDLNDFAVSLVVNFKNKKEMFWKFFTVNNSEAQQIIRDILIVKTEKPKVIEERIIKPIKKQEIIDEPKIEKPIKRQETITKPKEVSEQRSGDAQQVSNNLMEKKKEIQKKEKEILKEKEKLEQEFHSKIEYEHKEIEKQRKIFSEQQKEMKKQRDELMNMMEEIRKERMQLESLRSGKGPIKETVQAKIVPIRERVEKEKDEFFVKVREYMRNNNMTVKDYEIIKKGEVDLVVEVPAAIGSVDYYCCAKKKKRSNEGDLSTAYIKGQNKKLPTIYLSLGTITKSAEEMLRKEFKNLVVKKIE